MGSAEEEKKGSCFIPSASVSRGYLCYFCVLFRAAFLSIWVSKFCHMEMIIRPLLVRK